jgi:hypothetical protein
VGCRYATAIRFKVQRNNSLADVYKISAGDVLLMKYTIFTSGPVASGFDVYRDFMDYRGGPLPLGGVGHSVVGPVLALQEYIF